MSNDLSGRPAPTKTPRSLLLAVLIGAIIILPVWAAPRFGIDSRVALLALFLSAAAFFVVLFLVPVHRSATFRAVYPGTPEQIFRMAADVKLNLQVNPGRRRLLSQSGEPGQPGSSYVMEITPGVVRTTTVVSSDPPRNLVTTITGPGVFRIDLERNYTPVSQGTLLEGRSRTRMAPFTWLLVHLFRRRVEAAEAQEDARMRDYLAAGSATRSGLGQ